MTEGGKKALKQTGDHNWDLERMQFQKDKGNISNEQDYVNKQTKQRDIQAALNRVRTIKRESTQIEKNLNYLLPIQLMTIQSFLLEVKIYQSFQS